MLGTRDAATRNSDTTSRNSQTPPHGTPSQLAVADEKDFDEPAAWNPCGGKTLYHATRNPIPSYMELSRCYIGIDVPATRNKVYQLLGIGVPAARN